MLVLTRYDIPGKRNVKIVIGDIEIWIYPYAMENGRMKMSIDAPKSVRILREELLNKEPNNNKDEQNEY
jgi:carbon storage regulator CsrA